MNILDEVPDSLVKITPEKGIWKAEHTDYIKVIEAYLKTELQLSSVEKSKNLYEAGDEIGIYFSFAKQKKVGLDKEYHYSIKQSQRNNLKAYTKRYFAFGVGSVNTIVLISDQSLFRHIEKMKTYNKIDKADRWDFYLIHNAEYPKIKGTEFKLREFLITSQVPDESIV